MNASKLLEQADVLVLADPWLNVIDELLELSPTTGHPQEVAAGKRNRLSDADLRPLEPFPQASQPRDPPSTDPRSVNPEDNRRLGVYAQIEVERTADVCPSSPARDAVDERRHGGIIRAGSYSEPARQLRASLNAHVEILPPVDGFTFSTPVRVRFADTDAQGIAHNAAYLVWFEVARVEYLRAFAGGYPALREHGIEAVVLESTVRYRLPARFDDELVLHCRCLGLRGARFRYEYAITRGDDLVADGHTEHACVDAATLRPTRVPAWLADAISAAES